MAAVSRAPPGEPTLPEPQWPAIRDWLRQAYPDVAEVTAHTLQAWLDDPAGPTTRLLDVRSRAEYEVSRLPAALWAPDLERALEVLAGPAATPSRVVVYCSVGVRSARLARALATCGLGPVYNLRGSIFGWAGLGLPLVDDRGETRRVHPFDTRWGRLLDPALQARPD